MTTLVLSDLANRFAPAGLMPGQRVWLILHRRDAVIVAREAINLSATRWLYHVRVNGRAAEPSTASADANGLAAPRQDDTLAVADTDLLPLPPLHPDIRPIGGRWPVCGVVVNPARP